MGDVALVPERDVLEGGHGLAADHASQAARAFGDDGVPLVRHGGGALLALRERLLDLADLGPSQMPDLGRDRIERGRAHGEGAHVLGVPVSLDHLGGRLRGLQPEPRADPLFDPWVNAGVGPDHAADRAHGDRLTRPAEPLAVPIELEREDGELVPEGGRLRVYAVRAADADRVAMLEGAAFRGGEEPLEIGKQDVARRPELERKPGVHDVG